MRTSLKLLLAISLAVICFLVPRPAFAEQVDRFETDVSIERSGTIRVRERIVYDFGTAQKHGIVRKIPYVKTNTDGKRYRMDIAAVSVADENGAPYRFAQSREDGESITLKVGDADAFVSGKKTYVVAYTVSGALTYFSDHDELYWNMTGKGVGVPIHAAAFRITLPEAVDSSRLKAVCYTGADASTQSDCTVDTANGTVEGTASGTLSAGEGLTAAVSFPPGVVAYVEPKAVVNFFDTVWGKIVIALLLILGFGWYIALPLVIPVLWYRNGRDPRAEIGQARAWFDPPQTKQGRVLGPGETGLLVDETVDMKDLFAVMIDLARRGYFKINEVKKNDFYLEKGNKDMGGLEEYELKLMEGLFEDGERVRIKDLELSGTVEKVRKKMYASMTASGFFPDNPDSVRTLWMVVGGVALMTGNLFLAFIAFVFGRVMPKKTAYGAGQANIGKSLKNFLSTQERQLEFQAKNQMFFEKLLPYAIAFGVEKVWADRFADIKLLSPSWYQGYDNRAFTTAYFLNSMHSSFSSFRSSATPTRSSSGFSSGFSGGSSGGGGGGGSVGSW